MSPTAAVGAGAVTGGAGAGGGGGKGLSYPPGPISTYPLRLSACIGRPPPRSTGAPAMASGGGGGGHSPPRAECAVPGRAELAGSSWQSGRWRRPAPIGDGATKGRFTSGSGGANHARTTLDEAAAACHYRRMPQVAPCAVMCNTSPWRLPLFALWYVDGRGTCSMVPVGCLPLVAGAAGPHQPPTGAVRTRSHKPPPPFRAARQVPRQKIILVPGPRDRQSARPKLQALLLQLMHVPPHVEPARKHRALCAPCCKSPQRH